MPGSFKGNDAGVCLFVVKTCGILFMQPCFVFSLDDHFCIEYIHIYLLIVSNAISLAYNCNYHYLFS